MPNPTFTYNGHTYLLTDQPLTWQQAQDQAVSLGGNLVTINDAAEQAWLIATFTAGGWIGYTDQANEGVFQWVSGENATYTNWSSGEPNNYNNEDYTQIPANGLWNDNNGDVLFAGIIEINSPVNTAPTLTAFSAPVGTGNEDSEVAVSFADLQATGDEADIDGSVNAFVVKAVSSGTLRIGLSAATATAWDAVSNNTVDAAHQAYWTPDINANGTLDAFTVVAKDDGGLESAIPVQATIDVVAVPDVNVTAGVTPAEGGATGTFTITLDSPAPVGGLTVNYTLAGTAALASDYTVTAGSHITTVTGSNFTIAAGETSAVLNINALSDAVLDPDETVILNLTIGTGYQLASGTAATLTITDNSGAGVDIMIGGEGDDSYTVDNVGDVVKERINEGEDTVYTTVSYTLSPNVENIVLMGTAAITGTGNELNNHLTSDIIGSQLQGLDGHDNYYVGNEGVAIVESTDNGWDSVLSTTNRTLEANVEELYLLGTANLNGFGNDQDNNLHGNAGDNILDGRAGADFMEGRAGNDIYYVDNIDDVVKERFNQGEDTVYSNISYTLSANVENLTINLERSPSPVVTGIGNALNNYLKADGRMDISAHAILDGRAGDDILDSNIRSTSTLLGGEGNDLYYVYNEGDVVKEYANQGIDTVSSSITSYTLTANVENLILRHGPFGDVGISGTGNESANHLTGNDADNILDGRAGDDTLVGGEGADILIGGLGKDSYYLTETTAATDTVRIANGDSLVSSYDVVTSFQLGTNAVDTIGVDKLDLNFTSIAANAVAVNGSNAGNIKSHHISEGIISFDDVNNYINPLAITETNLANVFSYLQANITGHDTVAFISEGNTFVFQDGDAADTLVELVGVTAGSVNNTGLVTDSLWIA